MIAVVFVCGAAAAQANDPKPDEVVRHGAPFSAAARPNWMKPDELSAEERTLLDKDAIMETYHPDEHSLPREYTASYCTTRYPQVYYFVIVA
jgi:hypothetical protein